MRSLYLYHRLIQIPVNLQDKSTRTEEIVPSPDREKEIAGEAQSSTNEIAPRCKVVRFNIPTLNFFLLLNC